MRLAGKRLLFILASLFICKQATKASLLLHYRQGGGSTGGRPLNIQPPYILPPNLPKRFYNEFKLFYTPREDAEIPMPPWPGLFPPHLPYVAGRGKSWFAADLGIMVEVYTDYCVPIFEPNSYFACVIFNYNGTAYLISAKTTGYGPCCIFRPVWSPPHRDFMQTFTKFYNGSTEHLGAEVLNQTVDWWVIPQEESRMSTQEHPVFGGYGWSRKTLPSGYRPQVCFWYEGNIGWTQQLYYNFVDSGPRTHDLDDFKLPEFCHTQRACLQTDET